MRMTEKEWLAYLRKQAEAKQLNHLDVLIDATLLDYPLLASLAEIDPPPQYSLLFDGTPEHSLAEQGPVLVRATWSQPAHQQWLTEFFRLFHYHHRMLAAFSDWPFEALTKHLRWCTQIQLEQGATSGILRFYDPRLFSNICEAMARPDTDYFHASVSAWHWIDLDGGACQRACRVRKPEEMPEPLAPLLLDALQAEQIRVWTEAQMHCEALRLGTLQLPFDKEKIMFYVHQALLEAGRKRLKDEARTVFLLDWLAKNLSVKHEHLRRIT